MQHTLPGPQSAGAWRRTRSAASADGATRCLAAPRRPHRHIAGHRTAAPLVAAAARGAQTRSPSPSARQFDPASSSMARQQQQQQQRQQQQERRQQEDEQQEEEPAPMFGLPRVFSAFISGGGMGGSSGSGSKSSSAATATKRASSPGPTLSTPSSPSPVPTASHSSLSASAASSAVGKHPMLGSRLLNVGPNASPSVLAAALVASRDSTSTQPSWVLQAAAAARASASGLGSPAPSSASDEQASRSVMPPMTAFGGGGGGGGGGGKGGSGKLGGSGGDGTAVTTTGAGSAGNGGGEEGNGVPGSNGHSGGMVSVAELNSMLAGLRASLESIQASRAQYVQLLAERDTTVAELQAELQLKDQHIQDLEQDVQMANAAAAKAQADAEEAAALAAQAAAQVQAQAEQIAEATAAAQAAQEAAMAAAAQQQLLLEQQQQYQALPPPPPPQPVRQAPPQEVVISYRHNHWRQVYMHYNVDGKGWTAAPGQLMDNTNDNNVKVLRVPGSKVEFVFNNGRGEWDSPNGNYQVTAPGNYRAENGNVRQA